MTRIVRFLLLYYWCILWIQLIQKLCFWDKFKAWANHIFLYILLYFALMAIEDQDEMRPRVRHYPIRCRTSHKAARVANWWPENTFEIRQRQAATHPERTVASVNANTMPCSWPKKGELPEPSKDETMENYIGCVHVCWLKVGMHLSMPGGAICHWTYSSSSIVEFDTSTWSLTNPRESLVPTASWSE